MTATAKKLLSLLLVLCLSVSLFGAAAAVPETFSKVNSYAEGTFSDVSESDWYSENVAAVYELGLMVGRGNGEFGVNSDVTVAEALTVAARLHAAYNGKDEAFAQGDPWYQVYVDYLTANNVLDVQGLDPAAAAPRALFAWILAAAFPEEGLKPINSVADGAIPDVDANDVYAPAIYKLYRAGVLVGVDEQGAFAPAATIKRSEVAAIITRMVDEGLRKTVRLGGEHVVTFDLNYAGKGALSAVSVADGETVTPPAEPQREDYEFLGWYAAPEGGRRFNFDTAITADLTLYAHWSEAEDGDFGGYDEASELESAEILGNDKAATYAVADDVLTVRVTPQTAEYTVRWLAGSTVLGEGASYTVTGLNLNQEIVAEVRGTGDFEGTLTTEAMPVNARTDGYDVLAADPETDPVAFEDADSVTFLDEAGNEVAVTGDSEISLEITPRGEASADSALDGEADEKTAAAAEALATASGEDITITYSDVKDEIGYTAVDVALTLTQDGEETELHPVGKTTVTLSKENLGLDPDADLSLYVFFASHTNAAGAEEIVAGEAVTVDGVDYIRFTLNGLSRIWLGNVPPRTVTFDANGGAPTPEPQKVKFGGYAAYVEPPVRQGMLFIGWDHDLNTENILHDITVKALWTEGHTASDDQLSGRWIPAAPAQVETTVANGTVTHVLPREGSDAGLSYELTVAAPAGAVAYATGVSAEAAASSTATVTVAQAGLPVITVRATNENGAVLSVNTTLYIKWLDADGKALDLQSARVVVRAEGADAPGSYDTETYTETVPVNRGIGRVEAILTDGPENTTDYYAYVNGYLNSRPRNGETEYYLRDYLSFNRSFSYSENGTRIRVQAADYSSLRLEITPFEGETFRTLPEVSAYYTVRDENNRSTRVDYSFNATLESGKIVLTGEKPVNPTDTYTYLYVTLTLNGVTQTITLHTPNSRTSVETTSRNCDTWAEALAALAEGIQRVYYNGTEDVTLTETLTLAEDQSLYTQLAELTVGAGGKLILTVGSESGSDLYGKAITVARGGEITTVTSPTETGTRFIPYVGGQETGITVKNGGKITVPEDGILHIQNGQGGLTVEQGGEIIVAGDFYSYRNSDSDTISTLAGTVTITGTADFDDTLSVTETGLIEVSDSARLEVYAGLLNHGTLDLVDGTALLSGRSENYGEITVESGSLSMLNTGYTVVNEGTIVLNADGTMDCTGTVLLNNGSISGEGTLLNGEYYDTSDYDNGIEYVESDNHRPNDYSRYQFVRDPAATVELIHFVGSLAGNGSCTVTVQR